MARRRRRHSGRRKSSNKGLRHYSKSKSPAAKAKRSRAAKKAARTRARKHAKSIPSSRAARKAARKGRVSILLAMKPVRYFKRRGKLLARCAFCRRVIHGGMRGMAGHADRCAPWSESVRLLAQTPGEVQSELVRAAESGPHPR